MTLLEEAQAAISGPRESDYGPKLQNFTQIAMGFQMVLAMKLQPGTRITPEDVALLMLQVKIARLAKSPQHHDSWVDVAGYAGCAGAIQEERDNGVPLKGVLIDSGAL